MAERSESRRAAQRGSALLVTMTALALLSSIVALAVLQARGDFLIHHHSRAALVAFATAEAGLELALADLRRDARFSRLAAASGGPYPFATAPPEFFPREPSRFAVTVVARDADRIDLISASSGIGRARARVAATVRRDSAPFVPATLQSRAAPPSLLLGDGFRIDASRTGGVPGLAVSDASTARALAADLDPTTAAQIRGDPPIGASDSDLGPELFAHVETAGQRLPPEVSGTLGRGLFFAPQPLHALAASASGILVVDGDLSVDAAFQFDGVLIVRGDLLFAESSDVRIAGAVIQEAPGASLHLRGRGEIRYDADVLRAFESDFAGLLQRRATIEGWRDDS